MEVFGIILAAIYGGLMLIATFQEKPLNIISGIIMTGSLLTLAYSFLRYVDHNNQILLLIGGMVIISLGTVINGIKQKDFHLSHHAIRLVVEIMIVIICMQK
ncbi:hypothetical protein [Lactobacillus sp.]|uniref:hypothetical protein n=1 Tax=Lactobacillus sp. TaxID=1591 RepID=UPI0019C6E112|nr:hypothetical protein [Lactobacillus sp.]MBD5429246.1 hypothetical protein [Lactobacillus sp.]